MCREAIAAFERARELMPNSPVPLALLAHAYNVSGATAEANRLRQALDRCARTCCVSSYLMARAQLDFDNGRALELLERALEERDPRMPHINVSPIFDCLRPDARFAALVGRMGLTAAQVQHR
jgi:cytochrome c-type biogenesis protein CcmH/NrfG